MKILICGAGAIGSNLVSHLIPDLKNAHEITVLDFDKLEERNVTAGTQWYTPDQIGFQKVEALQLNVFKWFEKDIDVVDKDFGQAALDQLVEFDLIVDCFDNYDARNRTQKTWELINALDDQSVELLHVGFSDKFTFAIEWAENYQVPTDITSGMDICELEGASAFVGSVASLGALVVEQFVREGEKMEILGGKFYSKVA